MNNNPLLACAVGDTDWLKKCLSSCFNLSTTDKHGLTCLHLATKNGHLECVRYLLDRCSLDVNQAETITGQTALHFSFSIKCGDRKCLQLTKLLLENDADPNRESKEGRTALHEAAGRGHTKCLRKLLEHGADITITDSRGRTACDVATLHGRFECARLLRSLHWARKKDSELLSDVKEKKEEKHRQQERKIIHSRLKQEAADRAYEEWSEKKLKSVFKPPTACRKRQELKTTSSCVSCNSTSRRQSGRSGSHQIATITVDTHQVKRNWESTGKPAKLRPYTNYPPHKKQTTPSNRKITRKPKTPSSSTNCKPLAPIEISTNDDRNIVEELKNLTEIPVSEEQYLQDSRPHEETLSIPGTHLDPDDDVEVQFLVGGMDEDEEEEEEEEDEVFNHEENDGDIPFHDVGTANSFNSLSLPATLIKGRSIPEMMALFKTLGASSDDSQQQSRYRMRRRSFSCGRRLQRRFSLSSIPEGQMVKNYSSESMGSLGSSWLRLVEPASRSSEEREEEGESSSTESEEGNSRNEGNAETKVSISEIRTLKVVNLVWDKASSSVQTNITESPMTPLNHSLHLLPTTPPSPRHFSSSSSSSTPQHSTPSSPSPSPTPPTFSTSPRPILMRSISTHYPSPLFSTELEDVQEAESQQKLDPPEEEEDISESIDKEEQPSQLPSHSLFGSLLGGIASKSMVCLATVDNPTNDEGDLLEATDVPQQPRRRIKSAPDIFSLHQQQPTIGQEDQEDTIDLT